LLATAVLLAVSTVSHAQRGKARRIGFLFFATEAWALTTGPMDAFLSGMRALGYEEGRDFVVEARFAGNETQRLPRFAAELVKSSPDVILAFGTPSNHAAKKATSTIPIVFVVSSDPVGEGLASSLARPGGNITGLSNIASVLVSKQVELLKLAVQKLSRLAVLSNPGHTGHPPQVTAIGAVSKKLGLHILPFQARNSEEIGNAFASMERERADAVVVLGDAVFSEQRRQIVELALKHRVPSIYSAPFHAEVGGLISYGADTTDHFRQAAAFVDRIFKGNKPGDIPIEQPTRFELVLNLRTAKALGIRLPQSLLLRADRVIE